MSDRDDFEAWHKTKYTGLNYKVTPGGQYLHERVNLDYQIWLSAVEHCKQVEPTNLDTFIGEVSQNIAELPDRNSPEDWPEAMLVTHDELKEIITAVHADFPIFAHAMPKSDDTQPSTDVNELVTELKVALELTKYDFDMEEVNKRWAKLIAKHSDK